MVDLRRLRVLRALAEHGTVTETAAALHLTPSAVSQQLRQLARELGVELLRPEGRGVRLTPAARILLRHAETLHTQWEAARAELAAEGREITGTLRLCGVSSAVAALAAPAVTALRDAHPGLTAEVREEESGDCFRLLLAGETDLALVLPGPGVPPVPDPRFEQFPLLDDRQDLLVPEGHRLARPGGVTLAEAAAEPWIVKRRDNDTFGLLAAACAAAGFTPRVAHEAKEWFAVSALVAEGLGVCLLPRLVPLPSPHAVVRVPLTGEPVPFRRIVAGTRRGGAPGRRGRARRAPRGRRRAAGRGPGRRAGGVLTVAGAGRYSAGSLCVLACSISREGALRRSTGPNTSGRHGLRHPWRHGCRDRPGDLVRTFPHSPGGLGETPSLQKRRLTTVRTYSPKPGDVQRQWYVIDATDVVLGRLASQAATILRGKHKPVYAPHVDAGDFVIIINADKVHLSGNKRTQKLAYRHSGYPGGLRSVRYDDLLRNNPEKAVEKAIRGMIPKNTLGRQVLSKLKVYAGSEHPHAAQQPVPFEITQVAQ